MATEERALPAEWFERWWAPRAFLDQVLRLQHQVPPEDQITRSEFRRLLEAHAAARFAVVHARLEPTEVGLRPEADRFPDFEVKLAQRIVPFELVEAYRTGSRRDEEFKREAERRAAGLPGAVEYFDPDKELVAGLPAIERVIAAKAAKRYTATFADARPTAPIKHMLAYRDARGIARGWAVILASQTGTGKTYANACLINDLLPFLQNRQRFILGAELVRELLDFKTCAETMEEAARVRLLVIDDLQAPPRADALALGGVMDRRPFISSVTLGLLAAPLAAEAQQAGKVWRINRTVAGYELAAR